MPDQAQNSAAATSAEKPPNAASHGKTGRILAGLLALFALTIALLLVTPVNFDKTYGIFNKETRHLECGSVVLPTEQPGATAYNADCAVARTQRVGYAGLVMAGAVAATAVGLARRPA